jgi:hypothetical protein
MEEKKKFTTIEKIDRGIEILSAMLEKAKEVSNEIHYDYEYVKDTIDTYKYECKIKRLNQQKELYEKCADADIDLEKNYTIYADDKEEVYFSFNVESHQLRPFFYLKNGGWIYENLYSSWSGMNEWITRFVYTKFNYHKNWHFDTHSTLEFKCNCLNFQKEKHYWEEKINVDSQYKSIKYIHDMITNEKYIKLIAKDIGKVFDDMRSKIKE